METLITVSRTLQEHGAGTIVRAIQEKLHKFEIITRNEIVSLNSNIQKKKQNTYRYSFHQVKLKNINEFSCKISENIQWNFPHIFLNVSLIFHFIFKHNHLHFCNHLIYHTIWYTARLGLRRCLAWELSARQQHTTHIKRETGDEMRLKENQTRNYVKVFPPTYLHISIRRGIIGKTIWAKSIK